MKDFIMTVDWGKVWEIILLPLVIYLLHLFDDYMKTTKYNRLYSTIKELAKGAVKDIWENYVKEIKGTKFWDDDAKKEAQEMAIHDIIIGLSDNDYQLLQERNQDFEGYLTNAVESALYDLRQEAKAKS